MSRTTQVNVRVDSALKRKTEKVFSELGLTTSEAIALFFKQVTLRNGLPFAVEIPNAETRKAIDDTLTGKKLHKARNGKKLFKERRA